MIGVPIATLFVCQSPAQPLIKFVQPCSVMVHMQQSKQIFQKWIKKGFYY